MDALRSISKAALKASLTLCIVTGCEETPAPKRPVTSALSPATRAPRARVEFPKSRPSGWRVLASPNDSGGVLFAWFGGSGDAPGQFAYPRALSCGESGELTVVDKSGRLQRFTESGRLFLLTRTPLIDRGKPTGLGVSRGGGLLVADTHYSRVLRYDARLELQASYGGEATKPGPFEFVTDVLEGPDGRHYVSEYGGDVARIQIFSPEGRWLSSFGRFGSEAGCFQRPMALAFDRRRRELCVADAVNHRIQVFDLSGRFLRVVGRAGSSPGELRYPYDLAVDDESRLWVAEFGNHRLQVLDSFSGASLATLGEVGRGLGQLANPWGVALAPDDLFYLLDSGNDRVYVGRRSRLLARGGQLTGESSAFDAGERPGQEVERP